MLFVNVCTVMCALHVHVYPQIDHGQDVSWLSELREVSVLFINLDPGKETGPHEKQSLLQQSFDVVYPALTKFDGMISAIQPCSEDLTLLLQAC